MATSLSTMSSVEGIIVVARAESELVGDLRLGMAAQRRHRRRIEFDRPPALRGLRRRGRAGAYERLHDRHARRIAVEVEVRPPQPEQLGATMRAMASAARSSRQLRKRTAAAIVRAGGRVVAVTWLLLQGAVAATAAWVIAKYGLDHPDPFFAPVAAVIALNATLGERGLHAVRLLYGVVVGILIGELALLVLGQGSVTLALATFVAMAIAYGVGGARITVAQAAVGAILTIAVGEPEAGLDRFVDALVGAGVALVFTQVLFSPEPVALVRRAEAAALGELADGLNLTARALEEESEEVGDRAMERLRTVRDRLAEVGRMRQAGARVARRSLAWRSRRGVVVRENENAGHLDLLGVSCLMLTRMALETSPPEQRFLAPIVHEYAEALADLAGDPGDRQTRQGAADRALAVARQLAAKQASPDSPLAAAIIAARIAAADLMTFAGVEPPQAMEAAQQGTGVIDVPTPPPTPRSRLRRGA